MATAPAVPPRTALADALRTTSPNDSSSSFSWWDEGPRIDFVAAAAAAAAAAAVASRVVVVGAAAVVVVAVVDAADMMTRRKAYAVGELGGLKQ
jgi:hypothetical protein